MWKNITSYTRSDDRSEVRTTVLEAGSLRIVVTKHINYGDRLVMKCENVGIPQKPLGVTDMNEGQKMAIEIVSARLSKMTESIEQAKI